MSTAYTGQKPSLSLSQIINMSVGFFGIQFAFGLQNANVSRIFQTLGAKIESIPILWIAAPLTGLLIQPIIGHFSDKTWLGKLGRRRPYFLLGSIFAAMALFIFPNVHVLWMAALMLWVLDASINVTMEPFRAFVGDMLPDEQRTAGFAMQSFFIGTGAVISSLLPYILTRFGISNEAAPGVIPDSVKISFYTGAIVFIVAIGYTVLSTREYSPAQLRSFGALEEHDDEVVIQTPFSKFKKMGLRWLLIGLALSLALYFNNEYSNRKLENELYVLTLGLAAFGIFQLVAAFFLRYGKKNALVEIMDDLNHLPVTMKKLAVIQFFSWFALFSMWIYTTPALAQHLYNTEDASSDAYNKMGNWVGVLFAWYNGFAAFFAFLLPVLAKKYSRAITHMIALIAGGLGLISFYFFKNENFLVISMAGIGFAWASILAMPYAILTRSLKQKKMGVYMGIFNFFIVLPQILAATLLGIFTKSLFSGNAIFTIVVGGCSMLVAAFLSMRLKEK
ncbi:MAG TPA: MFS transporter [Chitinophagaceae bacterium]|nr:MFS transporter [Chitinophagaceae bacterium]